MKHLSINATFRPSWASSGIQTSGIQNKSFVCQTKPVMGETLHLLMKATVGLSKRLNDQFHCGLVLPSNLSMGLSSHSGIYSNYCSFMGTSEFR